MIGAASCLAQTYLVVPPVNRSGDANLDWIGESIAEVVREDLASNGIPVLSRRQRQEGLGQLSLAPSGPLTEASAMRLVTELGADRMVFGRFERVQSDESDEPSGGRIQIHARIVDVSSFTRVTDLSEEGALADLGALEASLAWRILSVIKGNGAPRWDEFLEEHPPVRLDAMESYSRGLLAEAPEQRYRYFAQSARLAPEFSSPRFQLGWIYWEEKSYKAAAEWLSEVTESDSHYLEANFLLGLCLYHTGDYLGSRTAFELVANRAPSPEVYNNLGLAQFRYHDPEAVENIYMAAKTDPGDVDYRFNIGYVLWRQGDLEGARQRFEVVLQMQPDDEDAAILLERTIELRGPRMGDLTSEGMERLKTTYDALAFR